MTGQRERAARKRRRGWLAVLLVLMLTTIAALAGWYFTEGRFTSAPALSDLSRAEAEQVATKSGLNIRFLDEYSEKVQPGVVINTDPGAGTKIIKGGRIEALVSRGPERFSMPAVVGLTQEAAESAVQEASLRVGKVKPKYSETVRVGVVLSSSQLSGASLKRDTPVDLVVSRGPAPIKIKNYVGKPAATAEQALTKAGFKVVIKTEHSDKIAKDLVVSQDPKSGKGMKGDEVTVTTSLGPVLVTVPNVSRMGVKAAQSTMKQAGFKTKVQPVAVNYIGIGFVVYSNPRARTEAPKGSTITLYVV